MGAAREEHLAAVAARLIVTLVLGLAMLAGPGAGSVQADSSIRLTWAERSADETIVDLVQPIGTAESVGAANGASPAGHCDGSKLNWRYDCPPDSAWSPSVGAVAIGYYGPINLRDSAADDGELLPALSAPASIFVAPNTTLASVGELSSAFEDVTSDV